MIPGMTPDKIQFPVSYMLKVIMESEPGDKTNISFIESVLVKSNIPYKNWGTKLSKEGKYTSYSVDVTVENLLILRILYSDLKANPHVKFAV